MPGIGPMELIVVLIVALLIFGPKKLPELGKSLGTGMRSFKDSVAGSTATNCPPATPARPRSPDPQHRAELMRRIKPVAHDDELTVVDHLDELRARPMVSLAAFFVAFALTAWQSDLVLDIVNAPLPDGREPITLGPAEPFIQTLKNAGYAAILLTLPVFLYQAYAFLVPALSLRERRMAFPLLLMVPLLFVAGVVFCYLVVLPPALDFSFNESQFNNQLRASDYYDFATLTMLAMGLGFQVPVGMLVLTRLGVVSYDKLRRSRRCDRRDRRPGRSCPRSTPSRSCSRCCRSWRCTS